SSAVSESTPTLPGGLGGSARTMKCTRARADSDTRVVESTPMPFSSRRSIREILSRLSVVNRSRGRETCHETNGPEARDGPTVRVPAQNRARLAADVNPQYVHQGSVQLVGADLEELVARVGLQDLDQILAGVAARGQPGALAHLDDLAPDHRQIALGGAVG